MNHPEFMTAITNCYGTFNKELDKYVAYQSEILEKITFKYIKERFQESELESVFAKIIVKVNPKFKTPPSPADFEEHFPRQTHADIELLANKFYEELNRSGNSLDNIIVSDIRAQIAIESVFGSWPDFCGRHPDYEGLHRKNFVEAFVKVKDESGIPSIMYGNSIRKREKTPLLFGDKERCLQIAESCGNILPQIEHMVEGMKI